MGRRKQIYYISTIKIMVMDIIEWNINNGVSSKESNVQHHEQLVMKVYHKPFFFISPRDIYGRQNTSTITYANTSGTRSLNKKRRQPIFIPS